MQRFPPFAAINATQPTPMSAGNLLTPPTNHSGDVLSPISSSANSNSAGSHSGVAPYTPVGGFWPPPGPAGSGSPYGFNNGGPGSLSNFGTQAPSFPSRSMFSPSSLSSLGRNHSNSPSAGEGLSLPPPPYDLSLPPFPTSMPMSALGAPMASSLPDLAVQQRAMQNALMSTQAASTGASTPSSTVNAPESYQNQNQRLPPTPSFYGGSHPASAPAHQTTFPNSFNGGSQASPASAGAAPRMQSMSGASHHPPTLHPAPASLSNHYPRPLSYSLPAMSGPIMSNLHSPGSQMSLVGGGMSGGLMSGYQGMPQVYGAHAQAQQQQNDRPFKCDQCPQSFNRNHDLKRHKRIHLAVKPFPCGHCEKSFSRKDALKVRIRESCV